MAYDKLKYTLTIKRISDGVERTITEETTPEYRDTIQYMWSDGNYGCDCNRHLFFERAGGRHLEWDEGGPCSDDAFPTFYRYRIDKLVWEDGTEEIVDGKL